MTGPDVEAEDCIGCSNDAEDEAVDYVSAMEWREDWGLWQCTDCGDVQ